MKSNKSSTLKEDLSFDYPEEFFSYFCKIDEFPEVVANESKIKTSIKDSCYISVDELNT